MNEPSLREKPPPFSFNLHNACDSTEIWFPFMKFFNWIFFFSLSPLCLIQGFGEPSGEHWLGNDVIHKLTSSQEYSLHVQLKDREGHEVFAHYDHFYIDGEDKSYRLVETEQKTKACTSGLESHQS